MLEPRQPIEHTRPDRFRPTHCPRRSCSAHLPAEGFRFRRRGWYRRKCDPHRRVPRIECLHCGVISSRQSFSCTYYMKRPELLRPVAKGLVAGSANRQIAQVLDCAPSTVTRLSARIGRHCLLFQQRALESIGAPREPVVLDHFETFVGSQLDRLGVATTVGHRSWFSYGIEAASHRGSSRRAARKAPVRGPLPEATLGSVRRSTHAALDRLVAPDSTLVLFSDDHPAYRSAVAGHPLKDLIRHEVFPNPQRGPGADRERVRQRDWAMFPVDLLHGLLRHGQAHHRRETIAFGRRSNAVMERMATFMVWRDYVKRRSERRPDETTPAMRVGIARSRFSWSAIFARRLFPDHFRLSPTWKSIYRRELTTPAVGRNLSHRLIQAY